MSSINAETAIGTKEVVIFGIGYVATAAAMMKREGKITPEDAVIIIGAASIIGGGALVVYYPYLLAMCAIATPIYLVAKAIGK